MEEEKKEEEKTLKKTQKKILSPQHRKAVRRPGSKVRRRRDPMDAPWLTRRLENHSNPLSQVNFDASALIRFIFFRDNVKGLDRDAVGRDDGDSVVPSKAQTRVCQTAHIEQPEQVFLARSYREISPGAARVGRDSEGVVLVATGRHAADRQRRAGGRVLRGATQGAVLGDPSPVDQHRLRQVDPAVVARRGVGLAGVEGAAGGEPQGPGSGVVPVAKEDEEFLVDVVAFVPEAREEEGPRPGPAAAAAAAVLLSRRR